MFLDCVGSISWWKSWLKDGGELYLHHTFQKQSSLSQYCIAGAQGVLKLSVPTQKQSRKGNYDNVRIENGERWQLEHWRSIEAAYRKSPFFIYYDYKIKPIFDTKFDLLIDFNKALLERLIECLKTDQNAIYNMTEPVSYNEVKESECNVYPQVFDERSGFQTNMSLLDVLFNLGPETLDYLLADS